MKFRRAADLFCDWTNSLMQAGEICISCRISIFVLAAALSLLAADN
jgi:hypothetical protein